MEYCIYRGGNNLQVILVKKKQFKNPKKQKTATVTQNNSLENSVWCTMLQKSVLQRITESQEDSWIQARGFTHEVCNIWFRIECWLSGHPKDIQGQRIKGNPFSSSFEKQKRLNLSAVEGGWFISWASLLVLLTPAVFPNINPRDRLFFGASSKEDYFTTQQSPLDIEMGGM